MSIDRPNLASAFAGKTPAADRAASLTGLLAPRPKQPPTEPSAPSSQVRDVAVPATPPRTAPAPTKPATDKREKAPTQQVHPDRVGNVAVYLEPDLLDLARAHARAQTITYDELVVQAFAAVPNEDLRATFAADQEMNAGGTMPARRRRLRGTAGIQIQLRLSSNQRMWLDEKQAAVNAPSRSALVAACLRLFLTRS